MRQKTLDTLEAIAELRYFLNDETSLDDVITISHEHVEFEGLEFDHVIEKASKKCSVLVARYCCLRHISEIYFNDATRYDYAKKYLYLCNEIVQIENDIDIEEKINNGGNVLGGLLPMILQSKKTMKKEVLNGHNYDSSPKEDEEIETSEDDS